MYLFMKVRSIRKKCQLDMIIYEEEIKVSIIMSFIL
jgi:hypothetical protein